MSILLSIVLPIALIAIIAQSIAITELLKYQEKARLYIENKVMTLINQNGIESANFKIVEDAVPII